MRLARSVAFGGAVFLLFLVSAGGRDVWADPDQCLELVTDYSRQCLSESTRCGSFCFYAVCRDCENARHQDHGFHSHCSLLGGCHSHQDHGFHDYEISPCIDWDWYLHDPGVGRSVRSDEYETPDFSVFMELGIVRSNHIPVTPSCVTDLGARRLIPVPSSTAVPLPEPTIVSGLNNGHITSRVVSHSSDVLIGDLSHLPQTPGDSGAPLIDWNVNKIDDTSVDLVVSGWGPGSRQYRYWSYNGLRKMVNGAPGAEEASPSEFRVPFEDLAGSVVRVDAGLRGIFSFQVRSVDSGGVSSGNSNIVHQMIGMGGFHTPGPRRSSLTYDVPVPVPPVYGMPLPPLDGVSRPQQPQILSAVRAAGVPGAVDIELAGSYSDRVEYRWWPHGGSGPAGGFAEWRAAPVSSGTFRVSGVRPVGSVFGNLPSVALFDFEVRLVDADGIHGEASGVVVTLVGLTPGMPRPAPAVYGPPLPPLDVGARPARPGINSVTQVLGAWGTVDIELAGSYSHRVEYRWWPHSGLGPTEGKRTGTEGFRDWLPAPVSSGTFRVSGVEPKTTLGGPGMLVVPVGGGLPSPALFDFQVRLVDANGIPGDPSGAVSALVWGGAQGEPVLRGRQP